jgi:O-antigen/teichoic acid export membrane protein
MALSLAGMPAVLGRLVGELLLPTFSGLQGETGRLNRVLLKATSVLVYGAIPACFVVALYPRQVLAFAYGPRYAEVALTFVLLCINEVLTTAGIPLTSVYYSLGRPGLLRAFSALRAGLLLVLLYPAFRIAGLAGAASAALIAMLVSYCFQLARIRKLTGLDLSTYLRIFGRAFLLSLPVVGGWMAALVLVGGGKPAVVFAVGLVITAVIYGVGGLTLLRGERGRSLLDRFTQRKPAT